jgi:tetratricopeptide (TPR) repeat protein
MRLVVRPAIYLVLLVLAGITFSKFRAAYRTGPTRVIESEEPDRTPAAPPVAPAGADTNAVAANAQASTNAVAATETNAVPDAVTNTPPAVGAKPVAAASPRKADKSSSLVYLGCFLISMIGLGAMAAWDIAQLFGNRAGRSVMAEDYSEIKSPDYEKAEEEWAKGNHLDAIQMLRDYLKENPSEQHAAIRIAEIYEKDLGNYLAAALELEEVLNKKLPREKWGWTAIRLSNLYSGRLNQPNKALAVLDRIVRDYSDTAAARKARERLGIPEPTPEAVTEEPSAPDAEPASTPEPDPTNLPKGFRKKK